jgi:hypothetical protein
MQNSVLLVLDQISDWIGRDISAKLPQFYTHSWEIHIGDKPLWSDNPKCPGGPHLKATYDDYYDEAAGKLVPAFGFEAWCNMSG